MAAAAVVVLPARVTRAVAYRRDGAGSTAHRRRRVVELGRQVREGHEGQAAIGIQPERGTRRGGTGRARRELGAGRQGKQDEEQPLYLTKHKMTQEHNTYTIVVDEKPTRAGVDPYNKLIDRIPDDNLVDVVGP